MLSYPSLQSLHSAFLRKLHRLFNSIFWCLNTAVLFTWTDYKTIFVPVLMFACATAPVYSVLHFVRGCAWIWVHLLLCNISNQAHSKDEDALNRPWRPLPSGRVSVAQMVNLRQATICSCIAWSSLHGVDMMTLTTMLILTTWAYDDLGLAAHPLGKNVCNIWGYGVFQTAAVKLIGEASTLDFTSKCAIAANCLLIFTTIQAQDFPDVEGDAAAGRVTFPIYAPDFSRAFTFFATTSWSFGLVQFWGIGRISSIVVILAGTYVGARYYMWRDLASDKRSYVWFNCWLALVLVLPVHVRANLLSL